MITCKEDLLDTQASGDLVVPFQELAFKLGIGWSPNGNDMVVRENCGVIVCRVFGHGLELAHRHNLGENLKQLTLSDLRPRTKVEYELIKFESTAGAYRAMLDGEKLYSQDGESEFLFDGKNFVGIDSDGGVYTLECHSDNEPFYRKVERPVEWWEDAVEFVKENACNMNAIARNLADDGLYVEAKMSRDQWCDFARIILEQEGE